MLLTTHYIDEAQSLCDRIALIDQGKLDTIDTPDALINELGPYAVDEMQGGYSPYPLFSPQR